MKYDIALGLICLISIFCSINISFIKFSESLESNIEKLGERPTYLAFCLKKSAPIEWNVPINGVPLSPTFNSFKRDVTLSCISPAAFLVKVTANIFSGVTPF